MEEVVGGCGEPTEALEEDRSKPCRKIRVKPKIGLGFPSPPATK